MTTSTTLTLAEGRTLSEGFLKSLYSLFISNQYDMDGNLVYMPAPAPQLARQYNDRVEALLKIETLLEGKGFQTVEHDFEESLGTTTTAIKGLVVNKDGEKIDDLLLSLGWEKEVRTKENRWDGVITSNHFISPEGLEIYYSMPTKHSKSVIFEGEAGAYEKRWFWNFD